MENGVDHTRLPVTADSLEADFRDPPPSAKPRVWWHWMDGNVTRDGVTLDLEWMQRVGIGGATNIDAALYWGAPYATPLQVDKQITYLSSEWGGAMHHSVAAAHSLGLEFSIDSSPGWSQTGGPWVKPDQAMKKLVWSETWVRGNERFRGELARPPDTTGPFQNVPVVHIGAPTATRVVPPVCYRDVATIAYRAPISDALCDWSQATVTSSAGPIDSVGLGDGDLAHAVGVSFGEGPHAWVEFSFRDPQRIQALTLMVGPPYLGVNPLIESRQAGWLEASDDGRHFHKIIDLPQRGAPQQTVSFPPTRARVFRVVLERPVAGMMEQLGLAPRANAHQIAQLVLHTGARVHRFEDKAGYSTRQITEDDDTPAISAEDIISKSDVLDLTDAVAPDGTLDWVPPPGRWVILRFGHSLTGHINHPASAAGTGLEVDKLNRSHVRAYMNAYLGEYEAAVGKELMGHCGIQYMVTDSYESGAQNWTEDMLEHFEHRRGYRALPWLPVLAGRVVESAGSSDRFLWDFRKTLAELIEDAHYGEMSAVLHERGMGRYSESHELGRAFIGDGMEAKKSADIPMGAMWVGRPPGTTPENYDADIRESASVAHIYGKPFVAGESFTNIGNHYGFAPEHLKPIADRALAMGLNRFVISSSVHQPNDKPGPGVGLGPFGIWLTRKETWAELAAGWLIYLSRSCHLLQQGSFVADIAYLYGEDANVTSLFGTKEAPIPRGYSFDFVNPDALINELSVRDGNLVTRAGMIYRVLALDSSTRRMSLPVVRKIADLVRAGARVAGGRPVATPSLADDEREFRALVTETWGDTPDRRPMRARHVFELGALEGALRAYDVTPDVMFIGSADPELRFVHRRVREIDLYFVSNGRPRFRAVDVSFRVLGKTPELWRADTGTIATISYRMESGRTIVPLELAADDAVFVVFRHPTSLQRVTIPAPSIEPLITLEGPWEIGFPADRGPPGHVTFDKLHSWTESAQPGVKYFSGTANYQREVAISPDWLVAGMRVHLDLGMVKNVAEVRVNGHSVGVLWKAPFVLDITDALRAGSNQFEIKVTNLWPNRLIGDKQPGAQKIAYAAFDPFEADSPLLVSGLLGPVKLLKVVP